MIVIELYTEVQKEGKERERIVMRLYADYATFIRFEAIECVGQLCRANQDL